uniref:Putative sodium channel alpha-toxin Acra5 n=1 Tax=Androctonus crassicauda TaxID=122909 RepID=SCX5_ANDCR
VRDGYIMIKDTNCKFSCNIFKKWEYCSPLCQSKGAETGYCYNFGCWCLDLPDDVPVYGDRGVICRTR